MRFPLYVLIFFFSTAAFSQVDETEPTKVPKSDAEQNVAKNQLPSPMINVDSLYREDQFYAGFTYNRLLNRPAGISQNKFSAGFTAGFQRDMPINTSRTWAVAVGLGASYNKYFQNLVVSKVDEQAQYNIIATGTQYEKNKFEQILIDVPIELRWRTSTPESHKFWRIYSGVKVSYVAFGRSKYVDSDYNIKVTNNADLNKIQVGAYLVWGYNTWNFYGYYGLTPFFQSSAQLNNRSVGLNPLHLGLMFYIL
jgi:hypothetical protein